jgi:hypothetical protein
VKLTPSGGARAESMVAPIGAPIEIPEPDHMTVREAWLSVRPGMSVGAGTGLNLPAATAYRAQKRLVQPLYVARSNRLLSED